MDKLTQRQNSTTRVFEDLKGVKVADLTVDEYDTLISNTYLEPANIEFLGDLSSVMKFQEKPKGLQMVKAVQTGTVNSATHVTILEVPAGKTYDIQAVTVVSVSAASCVMDYSLDDILTPSGYMDFLLKSVSFSGSERGYTVDFSTMGDFLISGQSDSSVILACSRNTGSGTIAAHNVFYREVN